MARKTRSVKRWLKRRSSIEPVIGHVKSDNGMARNLLKGIEGDKINALLSGCGFNVRKLLAVFFLPLIIGQKMRQILDFKIERWIGIAA
jgi:IS5 family transposase